MRYSVLLVDDESDMINGIRRGLHEEQYIVRRARSWREALKTLATEYVDVVLSDEKMTTGGSGPEFWTLVQENYPKTIRMMLTASENEKSVISDTYDGWVYHYDNRPFNTTSLAEAVQYCLMFEFLLNKEDEPCWADICS